MGPGLFAAAGVVKDGIRTALGLMTGDRTRGGTVTVEQLEAGRGSAEAGVDGETEVVVAPLSGLERLSRDAASRATKTWTTLRVALVGS